MRPEEGNSICFSAFKCNNVKKKKSHALFTAKKMLEQKEQKHNMVDITGTRRRRCPIKY